MSDLASQLAAFLAGVACSGTAAYFGVMAPLARTAEVWARIGTGDLSQTVPELGPRRLRAGVRVFNTMLADFQEVLLLFAFFLRSARTSVQVLADHAQVEGCDNTARGLLASVSDDLLRMQEVIEEFKYFRVRIDRGTIRDEGVRAGRPEVSRSIESAPLELSRCSFTGKEEPSHE